MKSQRKYYSADFKAKVALEAIKGQGTINKIAAKFQVHPNQITQWKKQTLEALSSIFSDRHLKAVASEFAVPDASINLLWNCMKSV